MFIGIAALFGLLAFGLGRLTPPSAEGIEETTTTTAATLETPTTPIDKASWSVANIATKAQLTWANAPTIETWPVGLFEVDGTLLLFGTPSAPYAPGDRYGLDLWTSKNGLSWEPMGSIVSPEVAIHQVKMWENRFIATGSLEDGSLILLTSEDGFDWARTDGPPSSPDTMGAFGVVHASEDMLILSQIQGLTDQRVVENALPEEWRGDDMTWDVRGRPDNATITVRGPLGIAAVQFTAEELGLTTKDMAPYVERLAQPMETMLWLWDEKGWHSTTIEAFQISGIHVLPDGRLVAAGDGSAGPTAWTSIDGRSWTRVSALSELNKLSYFSQPWRGGVITNYPFSPDLLFSSDFEKWESLGVADLLPNVFLWNYYPIAASDAGIALVASTYLDADPGQSRSASIEAAEFTLTLSPNSGSLVLRRGEDPVVNIATWNNAPQDTTVLDFEQRTITFLDPDTVEPLVSFGFDEVQRLES